MSGDRDLYDSPLVGHLTMDWDGHVLKANRTALALCPDLRQKPGFTLRAFVAPEDHATLGQHLHAVLLHGDRQTCELRLAGQAGEGRIVRMDSLLRADIARGVHQIESILLDVTDQKRAEREQRALEEQLQRMQRHESLSLLARGVAHDFNNLLVGILGNAELALDSLPVSAPEVEDLEQIRHAAEKAAELCQRLLNSAGSAHLEKRPVDLSRRAEEAIELVRSSLSPQIRVAARLSPELPAVRADATGLDQVILNLLTNAAEAIGDREGCISIRTEQTTAETVPVTAHLGPPLPPGPAVLLEVRDDGCGMDAETRSRIFDPFFSTKFAGRGLGLASVLGILRSHGGAVSVESKPGLGTCFRVYLPACDEPAPEEEDVRPAEPGVSAGTILVVDDEAPVRRVAQRMLEQLGFEAVAAADGESACDLLARESRRFRAVLLDATMPGLGGDGALRRLKRLAPDVPVLLTSGFPESQVGRGWRAQRLAGFVPKPYRKDQLLAALRSALGDP